MELINLEIEIKLNLKFGRYNTLVKTRNSKRCIYKNIERLMFFIGESNKGGQ